jgi:hypothetical protein
MTDITVTNKESAIVDAVVAALSGATAEGESVFAGVSVAASAREARGRHAAAGGRRSAAVVYQRTEEAATTDRARAQAVHLLLVLCGRAAGEAARTAEAAYLRDAAVNAVEAAPPGDARDVAVAGGLRRRLQWGAPEVDAAGNAPWAVVHLPLAVAALVQDATSH